MQFGKFTLVIFGLVPLSVLVSAEPNDFHPVLVNEVDGILTIIAVSTQSNYERIHTWKGEIESVSKTSYHGPLAEREFHDYRPDDKINPTEIEVIGKVKKKFILDMESNYLFMQFTPMAQTLLKDIETGISYDSAFSRSPWAIILTPEYGIECSAYTKSSDGKVKRRKVLRSPVPSASDLKRKSFSIGDPRVYLEGQIGIPIWDFMQETKEFISKNGLEVDGRPAIVVEQRSNNDGVDYCVHIHTYTPDKQPLGDAITMVFSGSQDFYMTSKKTQDAKGVIETETTFEYIIIDGIYVPSRIYTVNYTNGSKYREETTIIKNMQINLPIPENSFTYENCGARDGDLIEDKSLNKKFIYKESGNHEEILADDK
jgi:hypothetical protein